MLSRVAENIYWMARYVERAENTARLVTVNANLHLDLPRGIAPEWEPLIDITGSRDRFEAHYKTFGERQALKFLLGDGDNPGSVLSALTAARENARTIRDIVPREAWEHINALHLRARDQLAEGLTRRGRHAYLREVILGAQALTGLLAGTMNHDQGYNFLRMGRNLERADMTTRIIDVRSADLVEEASGLRPYETIQWVSVLKSLTGYQMYRRSRQVRVTRPEVLRFLFCSLEFPRAVLHCVGEVEASAARLPRSDAALRLAGRAARRLEDGDVGRLAQDALHRYVDALQQDLAALHEAIEQTWFRGARAAA